MKSVHFGAGNIGRGFIGDLLNKSGYDITFIEVTDEIVRQINHDKYYELYILDDNKKKVIINNVKALNPKLEEEKVIEAICQADLITTSVWADNLAKISPVLAKGLQVRYNKGLLPVNIISCENALFASDILRDLLQEEISNDILRLIAQFANTSVDRLALGSTINGKSCVEIDSAFELVIEKEPLLQSEPIKGATYTKDLKPHLEKKLYIVNCGHAALAYLGYIKGYKTVQEAIKDTEIKNIAVEAMQESAKLLEKKYGFSNYELENKIKESLNRFSSTFVLDDVLRVGRSPLRKLAPTDRLVAPAKQLEEMDLPNNALVKCISALLKFENSNDSQAEQLKNEIAQNGVEKTLYKFSGINKDSKLFKNVIDDYKGRL